MKLSVIIPTCNRPDHLALCLERFAEGAQSLAFGDYEIIVTDDSPNEATEKRVKSQFPWVRWIQGPRKGPAANRNNGATQAAAQWLVFCDDDCLPTCELLAAYADRLAETTGLAVLEGRILPEGVRSHPLEECPVNDKGGCLWSCNFAIRTALFHEVGGFDERFMFAAMEDTDLHHRLRARNTPISFVPKAVVTHPWKRVDPWTHRPKHLRSELLYLQLHPEERTRINWRSHLRSHLRYWVRVFPRDLALNPWATLRAVPAKIWDMGLTCYSHVRRTPPESIRIR